MRRREGEVFLGENLGAGWERVLKGQKGKEKGDGLRRDIAVHKSSMKSRQKVAAGKETTNHTSTQVL